MSWKYCLILFALIPLSYSFSDMNTPVGNMAVVKGDVEIKSAQKNSASKAKVGSPVNEGDTIIAGKDSRAKIAMKDGNIVHISPETTFTIAKYENDGSQKNVELNLNAGKIRNEVKQKYDGDKNKYLIKTPTAVAGVRGTDFVTSHSLQTGQTKVITFSGKVEFSNIPNKPDAATVTVFVNKGEMAETSSFDPPKPATVIDNSTLKKMDQETKAPENSGQGPDKNAPPKPDPANNDKKNKEKSPGKSSEVRVNDKQDQSPETFDRIADNKKNPINAPPPAQINPVLQNPAPASNLSQDAIRQQNEKTKVIIKPQ